jgi:hypothetical protein
MWLAQFVCAPQFFKTPSGLCGHTVYPFFCTNWTNCWTILNCTTKIIILICLCVSFLFNQRSLFWKKKAYDVLLSVYPTYFLCSLGLCIQLVVCLCKLLLPLIVRRLMRSPCPLPINFGFQFCPCLSKEAISSNILFFLVQFRFY